MNDLCMLAKTEKELQRRVAFSREPGTQSKCNENSSRGMETRKQEKEKTQDHTYLVDGVVAVLLV